MADGSGAPQQPAPAAGSTSLFPSAGTPAAGAGYAIAIQVTFELDTPDGLRKILFGLEQDTKGADVMWFIYFQLQEKQAATDANFTNVVTLKVLVDDAALHPAAQAAANNGLTTNQAAHAMGPAADAAKGTTTGDVDPDDANQSVKSTLKK